MLFYLAPAALSGRDSVCISCRLRAKRERRNQRAGYWRDYETEAVLKKIGHHLAHAIRQHKKNQRLIDKLLDRELKERALKILDEAAK
ncbi:MAG: hypothetical protein WAU89_23460 [Candidatus Acidiferrales bacterium]